jgi:predicted DNA-binding transcriptional regulator AlpA
MAELALPTADPPFVLVGPSALAKMLNVKRTKVYQMDAAGQIPARRRLGGRCPRWCVDEIRQWAAAGCPPRDEWERLKAMA